MSDRFDIAIVGAGIAGASLAAELATGSHGSPRIVLLEAEDHPGYHATGRSAAFWTESYGGPGVQPLTTRSGPFLREGGFLRPRGALTLGRANQFARLERFVRVYAERGVAIGLLGRDEIAERAPGLRAGWVAGAWEPDCCDIDVAALHQHYLATARSAGARLWVRAVVCGLEREKRGWSVTLGDGRTLDCDIIVNAAGAWADAIASLAGVRPLGITPLRRTMAQLRTRTAAPDALPLVLDIGEKFYFKPESGRVWLSPHDETPTEPCDAAPEEIDVARAIARFTRVVDWRVEAVERRWAGLRSFAPDRLPVYGRATGDEAFFWFAGQGGFGIQTAPAAAAIGAGLLVRDYRGPLDAERFSPSRFD